VQLIGLEERTVGELAQGVGLSVPCMSHHISILKDVGVVMTRRDGKSFRCRLAESGTPIGDMVRTAFDLVRALSYVSNQPADEPVRVPYAPSGGAVPEFEPTRR
jgi:DNA-binding transcriptional ArsR family regulator